MMESIREHWLIIGTAVPLLIAAWIVAVLSKYVRLMLNIIRDTPPALFMGPFDFDRVEGRPVLFRAFDGTILRGMFLSKAMLAQSKKNGISAEKSPSESLLDASGNYLNGQTRGVIIFCHEYGSDMYSCMRYCRGLLEAGFDIFSFDFRSHGQSSSLPGYQPRLWPSDKEMYDCLGAIAYVRDELESRKSDVGIGLFGISRGAGAAILAAGYAQHHYPVRAVLTDSAFSTDTTLEWSMKKWVHIFARVRLVYENHPEVFWRFLRWLLLRFANMRFHCRFPSVRKTVSQLGRLPVFFIHGAKDSYIRSQQAEMLYSQAKSPRYLWIVPEAKHNQSAIIDRERYGARTTAFFEKYLTPNLPQPNMTASENQFEAVEFFASPENVSYPNKKNTEPNEDRHSDPPTGQNRRERGIIERQPIVEKIRKADQQLSSGTK